MSNWAASSTLRSIFFSNKKKENKVQLIFGFSLKGKQFKMKYIFFTAYL